MTRFVTLAAAVAIPLLVSACGRQEDRTPAAREALAAIDVLRATVDEFEVLATRYQELQKKLVWERDPQAAPASDEDKAEFEALRPKVTAVKERASKILGNLSPDLD